MEKERCIERENAMKKFIRKEGQEKEGMKEIAIEGKNEDGKIQKEIMA